jgi:uncharacterized protein (DUF1697 family)
MPRYVAFLRAINVGGHVVKMDALRKAFERAGFADVETFIASGNVIFSSRSKDAAALERTIERALEKAFGYEVKTFVRTSAEVAAIAEYQPFPEEQVRSCVAFCVGFLRDRLTPAGIDIVRSLQTADDTLHVHGREIYWLCTTQQSRSEFSNALLEKRLKASSTLRGVNTVQKLAAKHCPRE